MALRSLAHTRRHLAILLSIALPLVAARCPIPAQPTDAVPNAPPVAVADAYATTVDVPLVVPAPGLIANDLDPDGESIFANTITSPSNGTITSAVTNGAFTYVPDPGFVGRDSFTYYIRDASNNLSAPGTVSIEVLPDPNRPPIAVDDGYSTPEGVPLVVAAPGLIGNDLDPDGETIFANTVTTPSNGTITSAVTNGAFTYVPDPGFVGHDSFAYFIRDASGHLSTAGTVSIEVIGPGGEIPLAIPDAYTTREGVALVVAAPGLIANDVDPNGESIFANTVTTPSNGTITSAVTNGAFTYVPDPGFVGHDSFAYYIRDASNNLSAPGAVSIDVLPDPNRPPIGLDDVYATLEGVPLVVAAPGPLGNDLDPDGDGFILTGRTLPSHGTVTQAASNGSFTYVPDAGFVGTDTFTYTLSDSAATLSEPATVTIKVLYPDGSEEFLLCDTNGDQVIDQTDIDEIFAARGSAAGSGDPRDADGDGSITVEDGRICVLACTNPDCAPSP